MSTCSRVVLPACGLILFSFLTYQSIARKQTALSAGGRYFWWGSIRLDSDPLAKRFKVATIARCSEPDCLAFDPRYVLVEPGWAQNVLVLCAVPAFLLSGGIVYGLSRLGVSEVVSFMVSTPVLIGAWFYVVGWILDRRNSERSR